MVKDSNRLSVAELFEAFIEYYTRNDMVKHNISLSRRVRPNGSGRIFMENPFDSEINAAKNVTHMEVMRFRRCCEVTKEIIRSEKWKNKDHMNLTMLIARLMNFHDKWKKKWTAWYLCLRWGGGWR